MAEVASSGAPVVEEQVGLAWPGLQGSQSGRRGQPRQSGVRNPATGEFRFRRGTGSGARVLAFVIRV